MITRRSIFGLPLALIAAPAAGWFDGSVILSPEAAVKMPKEYLLTPLSRDAVLCHTRPITCEQAERAGELLWAYIRTADTSPAAGVKDAS